MQFRPAERSIQFKVVYYGPALCGKTTNLEALHEIVDPEGTTELTSLKTAEDRTLFFDLLPINLDEIQGYKVRLQVYTVPGQVQYNSTRRIVLAGADGIIFVADSSAERLAENYTSFENMKANLLANKMVLDAIPIVVQINKRDLVDAAPTQEVLASLRAGALPAIEASALTGDGVVETFAAVAEAVLRAFAERQGSSLQGADADSLARSVHRALAPYLGQIRPVEPAVPSPTFEASIPVENPLSEDEQLGAALEATTVLAEQYHDIRVLSESYRQRLQEMTALYELGRSLEGIRGEDEALAAISSSFLSARPSWHAECLPGPDAPPVPLETLVRHLGPRHSPAGHLLATPPENVSTRVEDLRFADLLEEMASPRLQTLSLLAELAMANERLERRVVERTADLAAALDRLKDLDQLKRAFLNGVSHEMRTPLTNIRSYTELLVRYPDQPENSKREYLQVISEEALRLEGLIADLLSFQKVKEPFRGQTSDLAAVLAEVLDQVEPRASAKYLQLKIQRPAEQPLFPINQDDAATLFRQLLDNAIKYSPDGVRVRVILLLDPGKMVFSVRDYGPGFSDEKRNLAMAPLGPEGASAFTKKTGLGLGLFLVREVLSKYGGGITIEEMEPGANVIVEVPRPSEAGDSDS